MLSTAQVDELRHALQACKRPLFFFHDDPDGFASFLMLYHYVGEGKGIVVKARPCVTSFYLRKVQEYSPDAVFILDLALVDQDFLDEVSVPVYWIDHHDPQERERVHYYNPRLVTGENVPTPALCYQITEKDLWLATAGCIGDWYLPPFVSEFRERYPDLLDVSVSRPEDGYFSSPLTPLIKALSFNLKGKTQDVITSIKTMIKIESPYEILRQETSRGKLIWKRYAHINQHYDRMFASIVTHVHAEDPVLVYTYTDDQLSLTRDLANELVYRYPDKVIVLGRLKSGSYKCSIRGSHVLLPPLLEFALADVRGTGGGHEHACGAVIEEDDFAVFISRLRQGLQEGVGFS